MGAKDIFNSEAGFITGPLYYIPNRRFIPPCVFQTSTTGKNLSLLGARTDEITAGSMGLNEEESVKGTIGEFVERYAGAAIYRQKFVNADYHEMKAAGRNALDPDEIRLFSERQLADRSLGLDRPSRKHKIDWVEGQDALTGEKAWVPAFMVYLPYAHQHGEHHFYMPKSTSTGLAAGENFAHAFHGGFFEAAERHAFSRFWYKQHVENPPMYRKETLLKHFPEDKTLRQLYDNPFVEIAVFDLSEYVPVECVAVFMFYEYKGKRMQTCGASARFTKRDALVKAAVEAYQGVEYGLSLQDKKLFGTQESEANLADDFDKHFDFYNSFPNLRKEVPVLRRSIEEEGESGLFQATGSRLNALTSEQLKSCGLHGVFTVDITPEDIEELDLKVIRTVVPDFALLTGDHRYPFLGRLDEEDGFYTDWPHPFP
ncbi:hypothetical protein FUAX_47330 (plasmid) [Fulvitalea axinellae]|uniref:YcaO domain-containing protein n=1 Tax=Fulvitalea axinellae TaxID=1182444 RepID=A0AAU9CT77_9BACT|nr:hypothetical protein FUAX_47330 [Fulvitalea axinellae]